MQITSRRSSKTLIRIGDARWLAFLSRWAIILARRFGRDHGCTGTGGAREEVGAKAPAFSVGGRMLPGFWLFEIGKLLAQIGAAAVVAWLGVRWALTRYKSERLWDRRLALYTELLTSITDMQRVLDRQENAEATKRFYPDDQWRQLLTDYDLSLKAIVNAVGQCEVLLSQQVAEKLSRLPIDLDNAAYDARVIYEDRRWSILRDLKAYLVQDAKEKLDLP
ncbi:hypothetical protein [Pseudorhizobium flavum]|uniref:hypothetical protein n=1 Tax=Pseudorhizobium flavum TaxID=1335061 RepID=UPI0024900B31|nr:hypothetical protein [Pseudorhizobium flavum]